MRISRRASRRPEARRDHPPRAAADRARADSGGEPAPGSLRPGPAGARRRPPGALRRVRELKARPAHAIQHLLFYAVTLEAEPANRPPVLVDVSAPDVMQAWTGRWRPTPPRRGPGTTSNLQLDRARVERPARAAWTSPFRCSRTIRSSSPHSRTTRPRSAALLTCPTRPLQDWHHLLSLRRRQRRARLGAGGGTGPARTRSPLHQLRAPVPDAGGRAPPVFPPGRDQRLRTCSNTPTTRCRCP